MRGGILKRRLVNLEQRWNVCRRKSVGELFSEAEDLVRMAGIDLSEALNRVFAPVSKDELEQMLAEVKSILARPER